MYIDTHAHLTDPQFDPDREAVIDRAIQAGVGAIITLGADVATSRAAVELAERYPVVYAAVGIHPESVRAASLEQIEELRELAGHDKVVAIGEIGLDYYWDKDSALLQQQFLEKQLELAAELNLPVSVHDREAHARILDTIRRLRAPELRGVLHSFSGDEAMARQVIGWGWYISFGGPVTFLNARQPAELAAVLPLANLLIETDSPYLSPHPFRGRRNEPANVARVAERIAELRQITVEQVTTDTASSARRLFGLSLR